MTALRTYAVITFVLLLATPIDGFARQDEGPGFGVEAGFTRPSLRGREGELVDFEGRTGLLAGIWFGGNRNGTVGVMGELIYGTRNFDEFGFEVKQRYIEVPVLLRVNVGSRNRERIVGYGIVGPVVDLNLSQDVDDLDFSDEYQGFDLGIMAGGGVEITRFGVEVRGNWGLRRFFDPADGPEEIKTFTLQIVGKFRIN